MELTRRSRFYSALVMLLCMLTMQMAVAACRCNDDAVSSLMQHDIAHTFLQDSDLHSSATEFRVLPHSESGKHAAPTPHDNSCHSASTHLQVVSDSSDHFASLQVAPFLQGSLILVLTHIPANVPLTKAYEDLLQREAISPQPNIRHCSLQL